MPQSGQGHAELTGELALEKIHPAIVAAGRLTPAQAEASQASLTGDPTDAELCKRFFRHFMMLGLAPGGAAPAEPAAAAVEEEEEEEEARCDGTEGADAAPPGAGGAAGAEAAGLEPAAADPARAEPVPAAAPAGVLPDPPSRAAVAEATGQLLKQVQAGLGAELARGPLEQRLLAELNDAAASRLEQQVGPALAAARRALDAAAARQSELLPAIASGVDGIERQVQGLEGVVAELEAAIGRLEAGGV